IGAAVVEKRLSNPPSMSFEIDNSKAEREPRYGGLCEGAVPLSFQLAGGVPPFDLVVIASQVGGTRLASVPSVGADLAAVPKAGVKQRVPRGGSLHVPAVDVQGPAPGSAHVVLEALLRDSNTPVKFDQVMLGKSLPADVADAAARSDPLDRLVKET